MLDAVAIIETENINLKGSDKGFVMYQEPDYYETLKANLSTNTFDDVSKHIEKLRTKVERQDEYNKMQIEAKSGLNSNLNIIVGAQTADFIKAMGQNLNPIHFNTKVKALQRQKRHKLLETISPSNVIIRPNASIAGLIDHKKLKETLDTKNTEPLKNIMVNTMVTQTLNMSFSRYNETKKCLEQSNFTKLLERKKGNLTTTQPSSSDDKLLSVKLPPIFKSRTKQSGFLKSQNQKTGLNLHTSKDELETLLTHKTKLKYSLISKVDKKQVQLTNSDMFNLEYLKYTNF